VADQRHPRLLAADQWAAANRGLLSRAFERFQETGEWASLEALQLDFARGEQDIDVRELAFQIPAALGGVEQQRLVLRVRALRYLPAAAPLLATWFASLQLASRRWLSEGEDARLTAEDVLRAAHGDQDLAVLTSHFLLMDRWGLGGGSGWPSDPDWSADIVSEIRHVRGAHSAEELLALRDEREHPPGGVELAAAEETQPPPTPDPPVEAQPPPPQPPPPRPPGRWKRFRDWSVENYLGAVAAGLTVLAIGALSAIVLPNVNGDDKPEVSSAVSGESTELAPREESDAPSTGTPEEAGGAGARTYRNPRTLSQTGPSLSPYQRVEVACRVHAPTMRTVKPDGYWYRILSPPWNGNFYAPANSFMNGDSPGQTTNIHNTDFAVPVCTG
jgi:hypothetical protein